MTRHRRIGRLSSLLLLLQSSLVSSQVVPDDDDKLIEATASDSSLPEDDDDDGFTPLHYRQAIDFRDLFLSPEESLAMGGSGLQPYGNMFHQYLWPVIEDMTSTDNSMMRDMIVGFTVDQSGQPGTILVNTTNQFDANIEGTHMDIQASNLRVTGIESFQMNTLLQPTNQPHVLSNSFTLSNLQVSMTLAIQLDGPSPVTTMDNTVDVMVYIPEATFSFDFMILMDARELFAFPINNLLEIPCWMNIFMDTSKYPHDAMELQNVQVELSGISLTVNCLDCSPLLETFLPELMGTIQYSITNGTSTGPPINTNTIYATNNSLVTDSIELLMEDAIYNGWRLADLHTATLEATVLCPHHENYTAVEPHVNATFGLDFETFVAEVVEDTVTNINVTSIELSRDSFEAILTAGLIGVETAMVLAGQKYLDATTNVTTWEPTVFVPPPNTTDDYLNWTNLEEEAPLLGIALAATAEISPTLANNLIRDNLHNYDNNTAFRIPLDLEVDTTLGHTIHLHQVVVYGLDSVTQLKLMVPISAYQLRSEMLMDHVSVEAHVNISGSLYDDETMVLTLEAYQMAVMIDVLLPIDSRALGNVPIGGILQNEWSCLVTVAQNASVTNLNVSIGQVVPPATDGYLSTPLEQLVNQVGQNFVQDFGSDLEQAVPMFFQTTIRNLINELIYNEVNRDPNCHVTVPEPPGFVDFQDLLLEDSPYGSITSDIYTLLNTTFFNKEGVERINQIIGTATTEQSNSSGVLDFLTDFGASFQTQFQIGNWVAAAGASVSNVSLTNLDSLGLPFRLIWPTEPWIMDTNITLGANDLETNLSQPLTVSADLTMAATDGKEMNIYNQIHVSFGIVNMQLWVEVLLKIAEAAFLYFPLKAAGNLDCWMLLIPPRRQEAILEDSKLPGLAFEILFDYYNATVGMDCLNCTSKLLPEMVERLYRLGENSSDTIEELISRFVEGDFLQTTIDDFVQNSQAMCLEAPEIYATDPICDESNVTLPPEAGNMSWATEAPFYGNFSNWTAMTGSNRTTSGNWTPETASAAREALCAEDGDAWKETLPPKDNSDAVIRDPNAKFFNIGFASFSAAILLCFVVARIGVYYKNKRWMESLPPQGLKFLKYIQNKEQERDEYLDETMSSLYRSVFIPSYIRIAVPIIVFANMGFFVVAHLATSIIISVEVNFGGDVFMINNLFAFNFRDGLQNTFANGGYEMAILLLIFGGVWPYFRCILSLILWFTPPQYLSSSIRGRMFLWIDAMNKLTVRDIFKFMVIIAIFFVYVGGPYVFNNGSGDLYNLRILGWPGPALYCGITAMIISRVSSRFLLAYHYRAVDGAREAYHKDRVGAIAKDTDIDHLSLGSSDLSSIQKPSSSKKIEQATSKSSLGPTASKSSLGPTASKSSLGPTASKSRVEQPVKLLDVSLSDEDEEEEDDRSENSEEDSETEDESEDDFDGDDDEVLNEGRRTITICGKEMLVGNIAMALAILAVAMVLIVGLALIPAVSIDLSSILELFLESGTTYEQAISQFGVYAFICAVVLKARLAVNTVPDYVAVVMLLVLGIAAISFTWVLDIIRWVKDVCTNGWRRLYPSLLEKDQDKARERRLVMMPSYLRLKATQYSTVYVLAYVIGIYQLGAVTIYAIHYFCNLLDTVYGALAFIGLITTTDGQCWEAQMSQYHNIIVLFGCFAYLTFMFFEQLVLQRKANVAQARKFLQELQEQRAWEEELANTTQEKQKETPLRRVATAAASARHIFNGSTVSDSEGWSNFESDEADTSSSSNHNHDLDGQYIGDSRFSFADPRYSFNDQFRGSMAVPNDGPSYRPSMFQGDSNSELTTITESENAGEDSSRRQLDDEGEVLVEAVETFEGEGGPLPAVQPNVEDAESDAAGGAIQQSSPPEVEADCDLVADHTDTVEEEADHPVEFDV